MNLNKFTEKAQEAVLGAQQLAESLNHPQIEPEHLLVMLVEQDQGVVPALLRARPHAAAAWASRAICASRTASTEGRQGADGRAGAMPISPAALRRFSDVDYSGA